MRLMTNTGSDRVIDLLQAGCQEQADLCVATGQWSLFAYAEAQRHLAKVQSAQLAISSNDDLGLLGGPGDRGRRNQLQTRWLAKQCRKWLQSKAQVRGILGPLPQALLLTASPGTRKAAVGNCPFTTDGLGLTPGNYLSMVHAADTNVEWQTYHTWFKQLWDSLPDDAKAKQHLEDALNALARLYTPDQVYPAILHHVLGGEEGALDEERVVRTATGIKQTEVWKRLYRFQRDGVLGAIEKLQRFNGCIIADSVGLGKTFEALAVIKYHELRNDRVLVLCPKRLRDNWLIYRANDRRNILAADRFHYDVLNHTDLSRERGMSGDIDLAHINWGNYDLVVIDESHNFRNKGAHTDRETRYEKLMRRILQEGVRTKVLMLSATPVNNRLADLRNQIAFITEGDDTALAHHGISSIENTTRVAQAQFNRWLNLPEATRSPSRLLDMLGFDYFKLLDHFTIARSRKHIEKYYGTAETGNFPERLSPINIKTTTDSDDEFPAIESINDSICRLNLGAYAPLRYILPAKQEAYDAKYRISVRQGQAYFHQTDREESLIHLMRVNLLKRMESSVCSFQLTLARQLRDVEATIKRIDGHDDSVEEIDLEEIDIDDPRFEPLLVGKRVKVLLQDVDRRRWRQDLDEDRQRLSQLLKHARQVSVKRDAKLAALRELLQNKAANPLNTGNRKALIFTAFADTAAYLYEHLAPWLQQQLGMHTALVTGSGANRSTQPRLGSNLGSILTAFSPRSKERRDEDTTDGDIDVIIATDCISEGQNLQDCDFLINYDIHWNPVRIIQRFGRIDRLGSPNERIQLVNFWPNVELEEYINLEARVAGRMVLLDVSATGEENLIDQTSPEQMNDLEYRRKQLMQLQHTVMDLEDLSNGISIADLTLTDFRIDLADHERANPGQAARTPMGAIAVGASASGQEHQSAEESIHPGTIFCLLSPEDRPEKVDPAYPLAPYYLLHVGDEGAVHLSFTQAKAVLDRLRRLAQQGDHREAAQAFDQASQGGRDMGRIRKHLATAVEALAGKQQERAVASLFTPGGTHTGGQQTGGLHSIEVVACLIVERGTR